MVRTAYVDESYRRRRDDEVCFYVLAAVLVEDDDLDDVRTALRALRFGKMPGIHWRREKPSRLPLIAAAVAAMPVIAIAPVCLHDSAMSSERARRRCLAGLLQELAELDADRLVLESRQAQDRLDYDVLRQWRRFSWPGADLRVDFMRKSEEPLLWAADCVAGATAWWLNGDPVGWVDLGPVIRILDIEPG